MKKLIVCLCLPIISLMAIEKMPLQEKNPYIRDESSVMTNESEVQFFEEKPVTSSKPVEIQTETTTSSLDLKEIYFSAPIIFTLLFAMSVYALTLWVVSLLTFKEKNFMPKEFSKTLRHHLFQKDEDKALEISARENNLLAKMMTAAFLTKNLGPQVMIDSMKSEGRRASSPFWQRLTVLNDIVMIAPMLGLLGTVMGMFYAFYDINRSVESINALFDGLGIAVGTTVFGLLVAIASMIFSTTLKYRLSRLATLVEKEALSLARLIILPENNAKEQITALQKKTTERKRTVKAKG